MLMCSLGPDAAGTMLSLMLRRARQSIDAAFYEVGPSYRWELVRAAERGVRVRLVLDAHASDGNAATARGIMEVGGECRVAGTGAGAAHGKVLCIDTTVAVGTGNLIWRDAPRDRHQRFPPSSTPLAGTREWWAMISGSRGLSQAARRAFDEHWSAATPPPARWSDVPETKAPNVGTPIPQVAPWARRVSGRRLHLLIGGHAVGAVLRSMVLASRRRVLVTVPYAHAHAPRVADLLRLMAVASAHGMSCALLLGEVPDPGDAALLHALPFEVRRMDPRRSTTGHAKGIVTDGSVLVSSANWSSSGLGGNWEAALRIDHPGAAAYYAAAWRRDWETGVAFDV
jgi:phosphatidylserine/phosphatidylglycerophosphate/cardiolipin synthase-like enzyme